jgi:hypothetical protein
VLVVGRFELNGPRAMIGLFSLKARSFMRGQRLDLGSPIVATPCKGGLTASRNSLKTIDSRVAIGLLSCGLRTVQGLGKTIEAGLVLAQKWTEGQRRILVITPANLRKQWSQELAEKFFLPAVILEAKNYNRLVKDGVDRPFEQKALIICSYQFAARHADELLVIPWHLVVIDEAHRLRNVYRPDNR